MKYRVILFLFIPLLWGCATMTPLTGGEKDVNPPKVLKSFPTNGELNFREKEVQIVFDEYFSIDNLANELLISPAFSSPPTHKIKGKTLFLTFNETPQPQTTYQLHFGNAIADFNEGNVLDDYSLVFSSGNTIDSGTIEGSVYLSASKQPAVKTKVLLYKEFNDSNVLLSRPYYMTYTDSSGKFIFNHISRDSFMIIALGDKNGNSRLEKGEDIGFVLHAVYTGQQNIQIGTFQYLPKGATPIVSCKEEAKGKFLIVFDQDAVVTSIKASPISQAYTKDMQIPWQGLPKDHKTYEAFISRQDLTARDTIVFKITLESDTVLCKTARISITSQIPSVQLVSSAISMNTAVGLYSNIPIIKTHQPAFTLFNMTDGIIVPIQQIRLENPFNLKVTAALQEGREYRMIIDSNAIHSFQLPIPNRDTLFFRTLKKSETGRVEMRISPDSSILNQPGKIHFMLSQGGVNNEKTTAYYHTIVQNDTFISLNDVLPGEYFLSAFLDQDGNGKWTGGDFINKTFSEPIFIQKEAIQVRANWDNKNIVFTIK